MHQPCWTRLVRFIASEDGKEYYGDAVLDGANQAENDVGKAFAAKTLKAMLLTGDPLSQSCAIADPKKILSVKELLTPVDVPRYGGSIRCLGTNYPIGGAKKPPVPILFYKPYTSLGGYGDHIRIPREVQDQSDYEVELVIVIGKAGSNVPTQHALDHVIGYTMCNDVSARKRMFASPQWGMGKSFDGWLPIGPCVLAAHAVKDPQSLRLTTNLSRQPSLNPVQNGNTTDMLWQIAETVSALSYGTTLRRGDIICTGTPDGQGSNRKPPVWLQDGEIVTVFGEGIGSLTNRVVFDQIENAGVATVGSLVKAKL